MSAITITLSDDRAKKLNELAAASGLTPEELLVRSLLQWLDESKKDFAEAGSYVLRKNAELYRRLAQ